jgi:apolipoprotein D and lipocalin family protein
MRWIALVGLVLCAFVTACEKNFSRPLPTVASVDLRKYSGKWHEVARLPNSFQRAGETATAEYTPQADGSIRVVNIATKADGSKRDVKGRGAAVEGSNNTRLRVRFEGLAALAPSPKEGNYWIIALDAERYQYAMVGTPDRKFLWILSRELPMNPVIADRLISRAKELEFPVEKLLWTKRHPAQ